MTSSVNTENLLKYVEALESGEFPQDPSGGHLKTSNGYCCLGVLREVDGVGFDGYEELCGVRVYKDAATGSKALPPASAVIEFLGLPDNGFHDSDLGCGTIQVRDNAGHMVGVHTLNDRGVPFQEIARLIRKTYGLPPLVATF